jgi:DNA/RNA-binding domain of Phe-tRNA-synthetase-like protein
MRLDASDEWRSTFPGAHVGALSMTAVSNAPQSAALDRQLGTLETDLRQRYAGSDRAALASLPVLRAYQAHYKPFGQTYHVLRQLESVALKGRSILSPGGTLVSAMFAAELDSLLLTAGHDLALVEPPLRVDVSRAADRFVGINGQERELRPGDMLMRDRLGIISAVLHGPDLRTRLTPATQRALFVTYAPAGIESDTVRRHLEQIAEYVRLAEPRAAVEELVIVSAHADP